MGLKERLPHLGFTKDIKRKSDPEEDEFNWEDALIDAAIMSGLTAFTTLGGMSIAGILKEPVKATIATAIATGTQFFLVLAIKRGLKKDGSTIG